MSATATATRTTTANRTANRTRPRALPDAAFRDRVAAALAHQAGPRTLYWLARHTSPRVKESRLEPILNAMVKEGRLVQTVRKSAGPSRGGTGLVSVYALPPAGAAAPDLPEVVRRWAAARGLPLREAVLAELIPAVSTLLREVAGAAPGNRP